MVDERHADGPEGRVVRCGEAWQVVWEGRPLQATFASEKDAQRSLRRLARDRTAGVNASPGAGGPETPA